MSYCELSGRDRLPFKVAAFAPRLRPLPAPLRYRLRRSGENSMSEPLVSIIMGSQSDWETMQAATTVLTELGVPFETRVVSAHRTPARLV